MAADLDEVRSSLEELLAPRNLACDKFLRSQLTSQLFVPITVLARCVRLEKLQAD